MKAKELKVGDIVSFCGNPTKVHSIDPPAIYVVDDDDTVWGTNEINNDITPIPLTSEIIEKNGWKRGNWEWRLDNLTITSLTEDQSHVIIFANNCHNTVRLHKIKYTHELQHILWALGMDDDLKI